MSLEIEERLREINLEGVVREIASQEYDKEKSSDKRGEDLTDYKNLIKEKLPKIINNIDVLGEFIDKCGPVGWYDHAFNGTGATPGVELYIGKFRGDNFSMWIEQMGGGLCEYGIKFKFRKKSIKKISLYTFDLPNLFNFFKKKNSSGVDRRNFSTIIAKNAFEFADKYANLSEEKLTGFSELPYVLSLVPKVVERMYKIQREEEENLSKRLTSDYKKLELLEPENQ
jgi:hypothetical protein